MTMIKNGFFAYSSTPPHCGEFIEEAIKELHKSGHPVFIKSWKYMSVAGKFIISEILREIEKSDFVCADLTSLNENVLFEIGFAIGKGKPIWLIQDDSIIDSFNRYRELNFLTTIGYAPYTNSKNIVTSFLNDRPYLNESQILTSFDNLQEGLLNENALLYLKSQYDTNYNQYITNTIKDYKFPTIIDDATEVKVQPISWYFNQVQNVPAVLVEFSSTYRSGFELHNAKCAFVAGLSIGLGLKVQMVAEKPFPTSIDYQEYLKKFTNLELCRVAIIPFLNDIRTNIARLIVKKTVVHDSKQKISDLQKIKFGEFIAEHEASNLHEYYVETTHEENLIRSEYNIVVGRKGCGKTATLYYLETELSRDIRNEVIAIKPVNFEIDGLIEIIKKLKSDFEKGYIIQSIWKFLIYTEIAKTIYENIRQKPIYALRDNDRQILDFINKNTNIILSDISTRLEQELANLEILEKMEEQSEFRLKISQILHESIIKELRELIISYMNSRKKLVILIDNLDKNWRKENNIEIISKFILGLLGVIGRISKELKGTSKNPSEFDLNLIVFLRSDIFKYIIRYAREPDKIEYYNLQWNDPEVLMRIVDKRVELLSSDLNKNNFWDIYVEKNVDGINTKEYINSCIIPRPRDLIYFINSAKNIAVRRGHNVIQSDDLLAAHKDYSNWIFKSILVENGVTIHQMHKFLYNVMGEHSILTKNRIEEIMIKSEIPNENNYIDDFITHLCGLSFLGREIKPFEFAFEFDFDSDEKNVTLANRLNSNRYKIHNAFIPYLECDDFKE
jgi:nucleoside 2-deoxyribosyltransferase